MFFIIIYIAKNNFRFLKEPNFEKKNDTSLETYLLKEKGFNNTILCKNCNNLVTYTHQAIQINSQHTYTFTNPAGIYFQIGCFATTVGCLETVEPTIEYTWFPGFEWAVSVCSVCLVHLGWRYYSGMKSFYGLILERLV